MCNISFWCIILLGTVCCYGLEGSQVKDPKLGTLLKDAHYVKVMSEKMDYHVYSKWGGYARALQDFSSLPVTGYLKEWDDGTFAAFTGNSVVILMRGPYPGHAWISLRPKENRAKIQTLFWYYPMPKVIGDDDDFDDL